MQNVFNPSLVGENTLLSLQGGISIPNAEEVLEILKRNNAVSVERLFSPETKARTFLVKMETEMTLQTKQKNNFEISEMDEGYKIISNLIPELKEKYESKGWKFESGYVGGPPGTAVVLYINIFI